MGGKCTLKDCHICSTDNLQCEECTNGQLLHDGVCITKKECDLLGGKSEGILKLGRVCKDGNNGGDDGRNNRCSDSKTWKHDGKSKHNCRWVGKNPEKRCKKKDSGKKALDECIAACAPLRGDCA